MHGRIKSTKHNQWLFWVQVTVTIGLTFYLASSMPLPDLFSLASQVQWGFGILVIVCMLPNHLINVVRWKRLINRSYPQFWTLLQYYGAGLFSSNFLPTGMGGDAVRIALLSRQLPLPPAALSVILDRALGFLSLTVILLLGWWRGVPPGIMISPITAISTVNWWQVAGVVSIGSALIILLVLRLPPLRHSMYRRLKFYTSHTNIIKDLKPLTQRSIEVFVLSVISNLCVVIAYWCALAAFGQIVDFGAAIWLMCAASFAILIPLTVNGLGLQESIFIVMLGYYNVPSAVALGVALFIRMLGIGYSALGGVLAMR